VALRELLPAETHRRRGVDGATPPRAPVVRDPIWLGAALADWWCHRRTDSKYAAGVRGIRSHVVVMLEAGAPALLR
jgi:hypothetical protein